MIPTTPPALLRLPANQRGRDFIVGDLHGMRALLDRKLTAVSFSPEQGDRLLSVGDLVDRGPDPMGCLRLLKEPWFYAVLGNHERMLLARWGYPEHWATRRMSRWYGQWSRALTCADVSELRDDLLPRLASLPLALRVGEERDRYYVVHAGRFRGRKVFSDEQLERLSDVPKQSVAPGLVNTLTWSRRVAYEALAVNPRGGRRARRPWEPGVALTYVGHTVVHHPMLHRSHLFVDRGGVWADKPGVWKGRFDLLLWEHDLERLRREHHPAATEAEL